jgi:molecular chaperone GrpE
MAGEFSQPPLGRGQMTDSTARATENASAQNGSPASEPATDLVAGLTKEVSELKDKHLRVLAEMENLRKRTEREIVDGRLYGITGFARDVVGIADNMRRALDAVDAETREKADAGVKALLDGVELTERELQKMLEKHGIKKFEPLGEKFDPNLHQAMFEVPDPAVPPGRVAQVVQAGYKIGERILRPALVGVSKGGPKPSAAEAATNDNVSPEGEPPEG